MKTPKASKEIGFWRFLAPGDALGTAEIEALPWLGRAIGWVGRWFSRVV